MQVKFWGVRGSVPWAAPTCIGHGCNTPCLQVTDTGTGEVLVLDGGSGAVGLGQSLAGGHRPVPILFTHYHWDHLQGLPFFLPLYETRSVEMWAPALASYDLAWIETIFRSPFFPIPYDTLPSRPSIRLVEPGEFQVGPFEVRAIALRHPGGSLGYRIRGRSGDLVYATDHEFGDPAVDEPLAAFCRDAAALVADAHFTPEEGPRHRGWGHGTWEECARFAERVGAGKLWLFHHKPGRGDIELYKIKMAARRLFANTEAAGEGDTFEL